MPMLQHVIDQEEMMSGGSLAKPFLHMQAPQRRSNGRHDTPQGAADAGGKWGHDKFQELGEDQSRSDGGQYKSILGLF